jgi:hypothetical protein
VALSLPPPTQRLSIKEMIAEPWYRFLNQLTLNANATQKTVLTANQTFYVRTGGNDDTGDGSADTDAKAFATLQAAYDYVVTNLNFNQHFVTIQLQDGTWTAGAFGILLTNGGGWDGGGFLFIRGDPTTPSNCVIDVNGARAFFLNGSSSGLDISGFKFINGTGSGGWAIFNNNAASLVSYGECDFGDMGTGFSGHIWAAQSGQTFAYDRDYTISGGGGFHVFAEVGGSVDMEISTITLTGTPAFAQAFFRAQSNGVIYSANTFSGSATGKRFVALNGGILQISNESFVEQSVTYLPGNSAGTTLGGSYNGLETTVEFVPTAFASLPTPISGMTAVISNSSTATWGATIAGGGATTVLAWYNGSNWTVIGA